MPGRLGLLPFGLRLHRGLLTLAFGAGRLLGAGDLKRHKAPSVALVRATTPMRWQFHRVFEGQNRCRAPWVASACRVDDLRLDGVSCIGHMHCSSSAATVKSTMVGLETREKKRLRLATRKGRAHQGRLGASTVDTRLDALLDAFLPLPAHHRSIPHPTACNKTSNSS